MRIHLRIYASILILFFCDSLQAGGPWLQKKGKAYTQFQITMPLYRYRAQLNSFLLAERTGVNRKTLNIDGGFYLEYGLSDKLNIVSNLPLKYVSTGEQTDQLYYDELLDEGSLFGLSNCTLGLKFSLPTNEFKTAISLVTSWNTGRADLDKGLATSFAANAVGLVGHLGKSNSKSYSLIDLGYHVYTNNFSDYILARVEHGRNINDKLNLAIELHVMKSVRNGDYVNENLEQTGLYPNNQDYIGLSFKGVYKLGNDWGINGSVPMAPIYSKFVGHTSTITLGIFKSF